MPSRSTALHIYIQIRIHYEKSAQLVVHIWIFNKSMFSSQILFHNYWIHVFQMLSDPFCLCLSLINQFHAFNPHLSYTVIRVILLQISCDTVTSHFLSVIKNTLCSIIETVKWTFYATKIIQVLLSITTGNHQTWQY